MWKSALSKGQVVGQIWPVWRCRSNSLSSVMLKDFDYIWKQFVGLIFSLGSDFGVCLMIAKKQIANSMYWFYRYSFFHFKKNCNIVHLQCVPVSLSAKWLGYACIHSFLFYSIMVCHRILSIEKWNTSCHISKQRRSRSSRIEATLDGEPVSFEGTQDVKTQGTGPGELGCISKEWFQWAQTLPYIAKHWVP